MFLLAAAELSILYSSLYVAGLLVYGSLAASEQAVGHLSPKATVVALLTLLSLIAMGLYQFHQRLYFREAAARLIVGMVAACIVLAVVFRIWPGFRVPAALALAAFAYALVLLLLLRLYFVRTVDENIFRYRTLIYGAGSRASKITDMRRRADRRGFKVVGRIAAPGDTIVGERDTLLSEDGRSILSLAEDLRADEIVIAMDERRGNLPVGDLLQAKLKGIEIIDLLEFLERETGKIRVDLVNPGWLIFSSGFRTTRLRKTIKRSVDILVSGLLLLLAGPIMLLVALAIKIEDGLAAPVLYRQVRVGRGGLPFEVLKFRSMTVNAEADGKAVWAQKNDSRVTRVGQVLRSSRLDELPQVINVLRGHMSIVGPRPERPQFVDELQKNIPYYAERHSLKPGVTGWAQLKYSYGASEEDAIEKLQFDLFYIKNHSLVLDLMIILQTVEVVLWGKGAR